MRRPADERAPCLVVGTGRCGSTLLSNLLRDHAQGASLSEVFTSLGGPPDPVAQVLSGAEFWQQLSRPGEQARAWIEAGIKVPEILHAGSPEQLACVSPLELVALPHLGLDGPDTLATLRAVLSEMPSAPWPVHMERLFTWLQGRLAKDYWIERSGGSLEYVQALLDAFPTARVVHLYRDGVACARSMARHPFFRLRVARLRARDPSVSMSDALARDIPLDRFGAYWSAVMLHGDRVLSRLAPERVLWLAYEDLVRDPAVGLDRVLTFLGDPPLSAAARASLPHVVHPQSVQQSVQGAEALLRACRPGRRVVASHTPVDAAAAAPSAQRSGAPI